MKNMSEFTKKYYHEKYFTKSREFQTNQERINRLVSIIMEYNPKKVLDVGCGWGMVVKELRNRGIEAWGIDFAEPVSKFWEGDYYKVADAKEIPFPDNYFDIVFSSDFFEHIPEEEIDKVCEEMKRVGKQVVAVIPRLAVLNESQTYYHVTNKSFEWWKERLEGVKIIKSL
jgi:ubiquinone/menaquinone biosynthesis C-methylase UbiE